MKIPSEYSLHTAKVSPVKEPLGFSLGEISIGCTECSGMEGKSVRLQPCSLEALEPSVRRGPYCFCSDDFLSQMITFSPPEYAPKLTKLGLYITTAEKFLNLLLSSIYTTRWRYNKGKCVLAHNAHVLCCTFKKHMSTCSVNYTEYCDIGHAHLCQSFFFCANLRNYTNLLFQTSPR